MKFVLACVQARKQTLSLFLAKTSIFQHVTPFLILNYTVSEINAIYNNMSAPPPPKLTGCDNFLLSLCHSLHCHMFGFLCRQSLLLVSLLSLPRIKILWAHAQRLEIPMTVLQLMPEWTVGKHVTLLPNMVIHDQKQFTTRCSMQRLFREDSAGMLEVLKGALSLLLRWGV